MGESSLRARMSTLLLVPMVVASLFLGHASAAGDKTKDNSTPASGSPVAGSQSPASPSTPSQPAAAGAQASGPIESQILAYGALRNRAAEIAQFLMTSVPSASPIVILDPAQLAQVPAYRAFMVQSKSLKDQFCAGLKSKIPGGQQLEGLRIPTATQFSAAGAALTAVYTAIKLTQTVTSTTVSLPDEALVAAVGQSLAGKRHVFYPTDYAIGLGEPAATPRALTTWDDACANDASLPERMAALQFLGGMSAMRVAAINAMNAAQKTAAQNELDGLTALNTALTTVLTGLATVDPSSSRTGWDNLMRGEKTAAKLAAGSFVAQLKVQSVGGESVTLDGFFFLAGASYRYSGGIVASALVFEAVGGELVASRNFWEMSGDRNRKSFAKETDAPPSATTACIKSANNISDATARESATLKCVGAP